MTCNLSFDRIGSDEQAYTYGQNYAYTNSQLHMKGFNKMEEAEVEG
jgi:hypothetical protein